MNEEIEMVDPIAWIKTLTALQLLDFVVDNPEYLADYYYRELGEAIRSRAKELLS